MGHEDRRQRHDDATPTIRRRASRAERILAENKGTTLAISERYAAKAREPVPVDAPWTMGAELLPDADFATVTLPALLDTLANPDAMAADASRDRPELAQQAGTLEMALDTADTI